MQDQLVRPSMKPVWVSYFFALAIALAGAWAINKYASDYSHWLLAIPFLTLLFPFRAHLKQRSVTLKFHDDHLTLETGWLSRTQRTIDIAKIQDVTVHETLGQRIFGLGDLMLESAGERGAGISVHNLDRPRNLADAIVATSKGKGDRRLF